MRERARYSKRENNCVKSLEVRQSCWATNKLVNCYGKGSKIVADFEEISPFFTLMLLKMVPRQFRELHWLAIKIEAVNMIK